MAMQCQGISMYQWLSAKEQLLFAIDFFLYQSFEMIFNSF